MANLIHSRRAHKRHSKFEAVSGSALWAANRGLGRRHIVFGTQLVQGLAFVSGFAVPRSSRVVSRHGTDTGRCA